MTDIQKLMNEDLPTALAMKAKSAKGLGITCQIVVTGDGGGEWLLDTDELKLMPGNPGTAACSIEMSAEDFADMLKSPQNNGLKLFFTNKMKLSGDLQMAMKLQKLLELP